MDKADPVIPEQNGQRSKQFSIRLTFNNAQAMHTACLQTGRRIQIAGKFSDNGRAVAVSS